MLFAELESVLLCWPDQLPQEIEHQSGLVRAAVLIRRQCWQQAEALLLAEQARAPESSPALLWLLGYLRFLRRQFTQLHELLLGIPEPTWGGCPFWYLQLMCLVGRREDLSSPQACEELGRIGQLAQAAQPQSRFAGLACVLLSLMAGRLDEVQQLLQQTRHGDCLELQRLQADLLVRTGQREQALALFQQLFQRCPESEGLLIQFCEACSRLEFGGDYIKVLRQAVSVMGEHQDLLGMVTQVKLLKKEPGLGLRSALLHQAWGSLNRLWHKPSFPNVVAAYEMCGRSQWFGELIDLDLEISSPFFSNLVFQLASIESEHSFSLASKLFASWSEKCAASLPSVAPQVTHVARPLRVAWVTPDVSMHPVSRFLLGALSQADPVDQAEHVVVSVSNNFIAPDHSLLPQFEACRAVTTLDLARQTLQQRVDQIRNLACDVVVDLVGWTGSSFQQGFLQRLGPLQVNYLGYFASTANPEIDVWLGDHGLFPDPMQEWHSERIVRLQRPFLAWQPHAAFSEAQLPVTDAPSAAGIRFGSFNANRKLSDHTLQVWGQLLQRVPGSSLVLKANAGSDPTTQQLLRRRMLHQGLDPERVVWLPLADSHADHLQQYAQMDVALDCFPNGGCTTTCEALWMGVPVITKSGRTYVSRMSTAVLQGAGLPQLCAHDDQSYIALAVQQAQNLAWLRSHRDHWRSQIKHSPLGDAKDLMHQMVATFRSELVQAATA